MNVKMKNAFLWVKELFEYEFIVNELVWFITLVGAVIVLLAKFG